MKMDYSEFREQRAKSIGWMLLTLDQINSDMYLIGKKYIRK